MADLLLPPNNFPWFEADGQNRSDFPEFFSSEVFPWLYGRTVLHYPTETLRNADLAGLGSTERAFAYVDSLRCVTVWTGAAWVRLADPAMYSTDLAVAAGFTGGAALWRQGGTRWLQLQVTKSGSNIDNTDVVICTIPAGHYPIGTVAGVLAVGNTGSVRVSINPTSGLVTVWGLTIAPDNTMVGSLSWPVGA